MTTPKPCGNKVCDTTGDGSVTKKQVIDALRKHTEELRRAELQKEELRQEESG